METEVTVSKKGITGTGLKIIALVAMFIDHFAAILLNDYLTKRIPQSFVSSQQMQQWFTAHAGVALVYVLMIIMRLIGRFGFPLFVFLLVEGFMHTRSVVKYALNLGAFALISELPFNLGFISKLFYSGYQNVFFTLLLGLLCMAGMKYLSEKFKSKKGCVPLFYLASLLFGAFAAYYLLKHVFIIAMFIKLKTVMFYVVLGIAAFISLIAFSVIGGKWDVEKKNTFTFYVLPIVACSIMGDLLHTDYGAGGVFTIAVMYLFRADKFKAFALGCMTLTLMSISEATAYFMLFPVAKYNGERGMKLNKYFFYAFYPVHLGLIYLLTLLLGFTGFAIR